MSDAVTDLVTEFAEKIRSAVEEEFVEKISGVIGTPLALGARTRRSGPGSLCPYPGCANKAAPVFGMVCKDHKDVPKEEMTRYREARKAAASAPEASAPAVTQPPANEPIAAPVTAQAVAGGSASRSKGRRVPVK